MAQDDEYLEGKVTRILSGESVKRCTDLVENQEPELKTPPHYTTCTAGDLETNTESSSRELEW